ncbi:MAG: hypothetical protein J6Y93_06215, partial [Treponema sp.]|nr:hypothetical protein [Treponema sp.]
MKEKFKELKLMFTRISTQIFLLDAVGLLLFKGKDAKVSATDILVMLGIGGLCSLCYIILLFD